MNSQKSSTYLMVIMRGLPGSGKSHLAHCIQKAHQADGNTAEIYGSDQYFMVDGEYRFDRTKLHEVHQRNQQAARKDTGSNVIIIDNTNTTLKELFPYLEIAQAHKRDVLIAEPKTAWAWDVDTCVMKNTHGVPRETIQRMKDRFQVLNHYDQE